MKVLLINPPLEDFFFTPQRAYPLGILYLATVLNEAGFPVEIFNCLEAYTKKTLKPPREFSYLRRYYQPNRSPFCLFSHYYRFGADEDKIRETITRLQPALVGISANFSAYFDSALTLSKLVKQIDKRIIVVMGGRAPTAWPELALESPNVDFVLRGEAEYSFLKLCQGMKKGRLGKLDGLSYKISSQRLKISPHLPAIKDLNELPLLNRRLMDYTRYQFQGMLSTSLLASRGCEMKCNFCAIREPFRYRRAKNVLKEIENCFSLGIRHFNFEDDNINLNPDFEKLLELLIERFPGKIKLSFMNGLLSRGISRPLAEKLVRAGLTHLDLSLVSSQRNLRKKLRRGEKMKDIFQLALFLAGRKIPITIHFIVAFPGQKFINVVKDIRLLANQPVMLGASIFYPVIESPMFTSRQKEFSLTKRDFRLFRSSTACFDKFISRGRIFLIFYFSRIINFIKELIDTFTPLESPVPLQSSFVTGPAIYGRDDRYKSLIPYPVRNGVRLRRISNGAYRKGGVKAPSFLTGFNFENGAFVEFLPNKIGRFSLKNNVLETQTRLDKLTLGRLLLKKLLEEYQIYRVKESLVNKTFRYVFLREEYISPRDIKYILSGLKVKGLSGHSISLKNI